MNAIPLPQPDSIPAQLRARAQWVAWTYESSDDGSKPRKVPKSPATGKNASVSDRATWTDFDTAHRFARQRGYGVGFVFADDDPYCGVDFDDCRDPQTGSIRVETWQQVEALDSYSEISPSGRGVKVFCRATVPQACKTAGVEVYDRGRFFVVTGEHVEATPETIEDRQAEVEGLVHQALEESGQAAGPQGAKALPDSIPDGTRDSTLFRAACAMRRRGFSEEGILAALQVENARCEPAMTEGELRHVASSAGRYKPAEEGSDLLTDLGNCRRFVQQHREDLRYCPGLGWLAWDGKRWRKDDDGEVMRRAKRTALAVYDEAKAELSQAMAALDVAQVAAATGASAAKAARDALASAHKAALRRLSWAERSQSRERLVAMVALSESESALVVHVADLDADPMLLNAANGTIDLRTGQLREHRREDLCTKLTPVAYDPEAESELWERYLHDTTGGDADFAAYLARWAGYCLTGQASEEQVALLLGPAATGKTTLIEALSAAMGDYAAKASFDTFLERTWVTPGGPRPDLAALPGVRLLTAVEASAKAGLDAVVLKELSGGDTVTVRTLHEKPFSFKPQCKIVLASNEAPKVSDQDTGVWRRLRRLPFEHVIPEAARDPQVKTALADPTAGGPAVLAWAVRGCADWQRLGLGHCSIVERRTAELRTEMDPLAAFLEDCCLFGPQLEVPAKGLRAVYEQWCVENGAGKPVNNAEWGKRLRAKGCQDSNVRRCGVQVKIWRGIGLLSDAPEDDDVPATDATNKQRISPIGELDSWETEILCTSVASVAPQAGELGDCATCGKPTRNRGPDGDFCCSFCAERAALLAEDDGEVPFA